MSITAEERARANGCPIVHFDPEGDERFATEPEAMWQLAYDNGPLFYSNAARGFFVASQYETAREVLQSPEAFSSAGDRFAFSRFPIVLNQIPLTLDPPHHRPWRKLLNPLFSPQAVEAQVPRIRKVASSLLDQVLAGDRVVEVMSQYATLVPGRFFVEWLGLDPDDHEAHVQTALRFVYMSPEEDPEGKVRVQLQADLAKTLADLFDARREDPREDIASQLLALEFEGRRLEQQELLEIAELLFLAGLETTAGSLGYTLWHLATHPAHQQQLREEPALLSRAIDELLRFHSNTGITGRTATRQTELNGCPIEPGDRIYLAMPSVNRGMSDGLDLERFPNRSAVFGLGPHRCLGSHIAKYEIQVAVEEWQNRIPDYRLADGFDLRHRHQFMTSPETLLIDIGGKRMKLRVDHNLCTGHAQCVLAAPDLVELDEEGYAKDPAGDVAPDQLSQAHAAVAICPEQAISLEA